MSLPEPYYDRDGITIYHGDCRDILPHLEPVDLVLTDPPYGTTQCKWDSVVKMPALWPVLESMSPAFLFFAAQPFSSYLIMTRPELFAYEWIWHKTQATGHLNSSWQPMREHEHILAFGALPFNRQLTTKPEHDRRPVSRNSQNNSVYGKEAVGKIRKLPRDKRVPTTILKFASSQKRHHPTEKPLPLVKYLVETHSNAGNTIADFCMGSGTTLRAAKDLGRQAIGIEIEERYCEIAANRLAQGVLQFSE